MILQATFTTSCVLGGLCSLASILIPAVRCFAPSGGFRRTRITFRPSPRPFTIVFDGAKSTLDFLEEEDNQLDTVDQQNVDGDSIRKEITSLDMVLGMTTQRCEESTVATEIAMGVIAHQQQADDQATEVTQEAGAVKASKTTTIATLESVESIEAPTVFKIINFAVPAIGVWLCSPLLSLIDTSAVGLLSGTAQQAALNPAVAVAEYTALLIAFMYTGTTNLVAAAQEDERSSDEKPQTTSNFIAALQLSGFVGCALGSTLLAVSVPALRAIIGNDAIDPEVFAVALKYVRIRAMGMPAAAIIGSAQAACLGMQDIKSPFFVLLAAALVNFCGDIIFVGKTHPWIGGAAGAALATVISQYAAVTLFVHLLCHGSSNSDDTTRYGLLSKRFRKKVAVSQEGHYSTRGFLEGSFRGRNFFQFPSRQKISDFTPYIIPVTSTQVGRVSSYVAMSHVVASSLGTANMAAQQVIMSLWNCLYPVGESLSLTAQSFVPSLFAKKPSQARTDALRLTLLNFWKAGLIFGAGLLGAVLCIPRFSHCFTADPDVMSLINSVVPFLLVIFSTLGVFTSSEGVLLGQRDLGFLGKSYGGFFLIMPCLMLRIKRTAQFGNAHVGLRSVWAVFMSYQLFRTAMWMLRAMLLQKRTAYMTK